MRLQTSSAGLAIGDADNRYLRLAGGTLTGELNALAGLNTTRPYSSGLVPAGLSDPPPSFPFVTEWNNAGKNWTAIRVSVTNTASGANSKLQDWQAGGVSVASVKPDGIEATYYRSSTSMVLVPGNNTLYLSTPYSGTYASFNQANAVFTAGYKLGWGNVYGSLTTALTEASAGVLEINDGSGNLRDWKARRGSLSEYLDIAEISAPAAPAANTARLYVEDNGSGKTRLMVLFPTGAAQVLATEP